MSIKEIWNRFIEGTKDEKETEFLPAVLEVTETPPSPVGRLVLWSIIGLLVVGLLWSVIGKVDEVAVATGRIIPVGQVKVVQAEDKGVIKNIYVKEGDYVKAGQLLIELDTTRTKADVDMLKKQLAYYYLTIERLTAELNNQPFVPTTSPDVDPKDVLAQTSLYQSRITQHKAQLSTISMAIEQNKAALNSAIAQKDKYENLLIIARDMEERLATLADTGAVSKFQLMQQQATRIEYEQTVRAQSEEILKAKAALAEKEETLANAVANYHKEVMTDLVEARKQYNTYSEELKKADETNRLSLITAPVDGKVTQLSMHTVGGIVTEAQALMMIVPDDVDLEFEVWANNKDIGFIRLQQQAEVKVETFNFQKFGVVDAVVSEISPDAVTSNTDKEKDKKYRLALTMNKKDMLVDGQRVPLSPGMAVTAEIKIRQKRIIDFFLDPFRQYTSEALRER